MGGCIKGTLFSAVGKEKKPEKEAEQSSGQDSRQLTVEIVMTIEYRVRKKGIISCRGGKIEKGSITRKRL